MLKYESEWQNQANRSSFFMISRAKRAQVSKEQEKKICLGRCSYNSEKYGCGALLLKIWYINLHFQATASFLEISSADTATVVILKVKLMDWFEESSPPASPP